MTNDLTLTGPHKRFEDIKKIDENGLEYWTARELMPLLEYTDWRNFNSVILKAQEACRNSGQTVENHFVDVNKMIKIAVGTAKETTRLILDYKLSRYACYLIAQNGDPSKQAIATAQTYFAIQTRAQEVFQQLNEGEKRLFVRGEIKAHNKKLFATAKEAGVSNFARFNNAGYEGLYGMNKQQIQRAKGIGKDDILDRAGRTELAANLFRITQTDEKISNDNIKGEYKASHTHYEVGRKVRQAIRDIGGTMPEKLPVEKHIRELERELKQIGATEHKKITSADEQSLPSENLTIRIPEKSTTSLLTRLNKLLRSKPGPVPVVIEIPHKDGSIKGLVLPFTVKVTEKLKSEIDDLLSDSQ